MKLFEVMKNVVKTESLPKELKYLIEENRIRAVHDSRTEFSITLNGNKLEYAITSHTGEVIGPVITWYTDIENMRAEVTAGFIRNPNIEHANVHARLAFDMTLQELLSHVVARYRSEIGYHPTA